MDRLLFFDEPEGDVLTRFEIVKPLNTIVECVFRFFDLFATDGN